MAKNPLLKKNATSASTTLVECYADRRLFLPTMPPDVEKEVAKNGFIPCEGSGNPGIWCDGCRFAKVHPPDLE